MGVGVFAILFISEAIANVAFKKDSLMSQSIIVISYASMACYMFHRFFFWAGELIWNPTINWVKWLYMAGVIFPIMILLSFYIQKWYDLLINKLIKHKV